MYSSCDKTGLSSTGHFASQCFSFLICQIKIMRPIQNQGSLWGLNVIKMCELILKSLMQYANKVLKEILNKVVPFKNCSYVFVKGNNFLSSVNSLFIYSTKCSLSISSLLDTVLCTRWPFLKNTHLLGKATHTQLIYYECSY